MKIEQQLKDQCTPEFIKWMCGLAEGFDVGRDDSIYFVDRLQFTNPQRMLYDEKYSMFPLLIHRAAEGFNKKDVEYQIRIDGNEIYIPTWEFGESSCKFFKKSTDYQPQTLTQAECAMLDCLLDIFENIK